MRYLILVVVIPFILVGVIIAIIWYDYQADMNVIEGNSSEYDNPCDDLDSHIVFRLHCKD